MEWTDIQITVPQQYAETAEAIATMVSNGGIYIEDYRDLEQQAWEIAHVDLIEQDLLDQPRDIVKVHMYLAPDENPAEILPLFKERLEASGVEYKLETNGIEQEDWQNAWKKYYHAMDIGQRLAIVPGWETYDTDRIVITMDPGMAFGTGTHETTSLCLETLDSMVKGGGEALAHFVVTENETRQEDPFLGLADGLEHDRIGGFAVVQHGEVVAFEHTAAGDAGAGVDEVVPCVRDFVLVDEPFRFFRQ